MQPSLLRLTTSAGSPLRAVYVATVAILTGCTTTRVTLAPLSPPAGAERGALVRGDRDLALRQLEIAASGDSQSGARAALDEFALRYAREQENANPPEALGLYLSVAARGYADVMHGRAPASAASGEPPYVESYNQSVAGVVKMLQKMPGGMRSSHAASSAGREFKVTARAGDAVSGIHRYDQWLPARELKQKGLEPHYTTPGLGAPLIAVRENRQASAMDRHQPDEGIFHPATAVLRFPEVRNSSARDVREASLALYNPVLTAEVKVGNARWPLAADYTLPWAALLSRTGGLLKSRWTALARPEESPRPHRLYLMQPYMPDRIPVVMVHGLGSTPLVWVQLTHELTGDPEIRRHYQIWHYLYPTGFPPLSNAADFREELEEVRRMLDPRGRDFGTNNMIVIGHSMGGVMTHTLVSDSGDDVWNAVFTKPASALSQYPRQVHELRRWFYFQRKPWVKRVVFISAPHRGSTMAAGPIGRLVSSQVRIPGRLHALVSSLQESVPGLLRPEAQALFEHGFPDSIRGLSPLSKGLLALAERPIPSSTPYHSIIGDRGRGDGVNSSDGVVAWSSAHLDGARSELVVPANHHTAGHPGTIAEVKRILKLHLAERKQSR